MAVTLIVTLHCEWPLEVRGTTGDVIIPSMTGAIEEESKIAARESHEVIVTEPYSAHQLGNPLNFQYFPLLDLVCWYSLMVQPDATAARIRRSLCPARMPRGAGLRWRGSMAERHESASAAGEARRTP